MVSSEVLIQARGLTKKFGDFTAVDHIDFEVYKAECVGFLGPNGAGKTTTEQLRFFQLQEKQNGQIVELSTGMKRRLIVARALLNEPQILLLDEPTTGLDPQARHLVWDEIRSLRKRGVTIIITTHYMDEAAELSDRIFIMDNGKIIEQGKPAELVKKHVGEDVLEFDMDEKLTEALKIEFPDAAFESFGERVHVFTTQPHGVFERFLEKHPATNVTIRNANLEDVFLKLTGRKLKEGRKRRGLPRGLFYQS